jgi:uncharacterized coiled-coil protein SlyX
MPSRDYYRSKLETILERWRAEIDRLKQEAAEVSEEARLEYEQRITQLEARCAVAHDKLTQLSGGDEGFWDILKAELEEILKSMGDGLERVTASNETEAVVPKPKGSETKVRK